MAIAHDRKRLHSRLQGAETSGENLGDCPFASNDRSRVAVFIYFNESNLPRRYRGGARSRSLLLRYGAFLYDALSGCLLR